jgi:hypothetical protein
VLEPQLSFLYVLGSLGVQTVRCAHRAIAFDRGLHGIGPVCGGARPQTQPLLILGNYFAIQSIRARVNLGSQPNPTESLL